MKLYNPFKPHIVEKDSKYYIRKIKGGIWNYLDKQDMYWWSNLERSNTFTTVEAAADRLLDYPHAVKRQRELFKSKNRAYVLNTKKLLQQSRTRKVLQLPPQK